VTEIEIRELVIPASEGAPGWDELVARTELFNTIVREVVDSPDLLETPQQTLAWATGEYVISRMFGAYDGASLVGIAEFTLERGHSVCWGWVGVAVDHRRAGLGSRLADRLYTCAEQAGATTMEAGTTHSELEGGERLSSPVSPGSVPADAASVQFLLSQGFRLGQVDVTSGLTLPVPDELLDELWRTARPSEDYELIDWAGPTPEELIDGYARLRTVVSTAVPAGELKVDESVWDAARVREADESNARAGSITITTVARHRDSGELVGFTRLGYPAAATGEAAAQGYTLVLPEHRGHNLGLKIKINNLRRLNAVDHGASRVTTGNADENAAMLAINRALGFRPFLVHGLWQKPL